MRTIKVQAFLELPDGSKVEARDVKITKNQKLNDLLDSWIPNLNEYLRDYPLEPNMTFSYIVDDVENLLKDAFNLGKEMEKKERMEE